MRKIIFIILFLNITVFFNACDPYEHILKSNDFERKALAAKEYYNAQEFERAAPLLEEVIAYYKGQKDISDYYYYYAYCYYGMKEYVSAQYYFKQFAISYPQHTNAENAAFMSAYCYYKLTPKPSLDQTYTQEAMDMLQDFVNKYPKSTLRLRALDLFKDLRYKLEEKAMLAAYTYYKTMNYKAAVTSYQNLLSDFPETNRREEINYMILQSKYHTAINSVSDKKIERLEEVINFYHQFVVSYPTSAYVHKAETINNNAENLLNKIKKSS